MKKDCFVAVKKDDNGKLIAFKGRNGKIYDYEIAKEFVDLDLIENAHIFIGKDQKKHINGISNGIEVTNLAELPEF